MVRSCYDNTYLTPPFLAVTGIFCNFAGGKDSPPEGGTESGVNPEQYPLL